MSGQHVGASSYMLNMQLPTSGLAPSLPTSPLLVKIADTGPGLVVVGFGVVVSSDVQIPSPSESPWATFTDPVAYLSSKAIQMCTV